MRISQGFSIHNRIQLIRVLLMNELISPGSGQCIGEYHSLHHDISPNYKQNNRQPKL